MAPVFVARQVLSKVEDAVNPRILIPCPTSFDSAYNHQCWPEYANAVRTIGGEAVLVPLDADTARTGLLAEAHGILLPGSGADVSPLRYGHEVQPETAAADSAREEVDFRLLELAYRDAIPTLAVCFGLQSLNVFRGGTLVQHLQPMPVNHRAGRAVAQAHATLISSASRLGRAIAGAEDVAADAQDGLLRLLVNSSHHQAVGTPGDGLQVVARSTEDAVIEAVEEPEHPFLVGVQWHPERTLERSDASRRLLGAFVEAARQHA